MPNENIRTTTRTTSMPTLRLHDPNINNHRASPPVKRNNDEPQINTLNNNETINNDLKIILTDTSSGNNYFNILI